MSHKMIALSVLVLVLCIPNFANAGISTFENEEVDGTFNTARVAMYSPEDAPSKSSPGDGNSFVNFELQFTRTVTEDTVQGTTHISGLLFLSEEGDAVGIMSGYKRHICCSQQIKREGKCSQLGDIILTKPASNVLIPFSIYFYYNTSGGSINEVTLSQTINIEKSGIYNLFLVPCPDSHVGHVKYSGTIAFMNPFGYLPGNLWPNLPFYGVMALLYIAIGIYWLVLTLKHKSHLKLHNCIAGVIALGVIEMGALYFGDLSYNISGLHYVGSMISGVIISTIKKSLSRVLVLVISMGWDLVKPTLGPDRDRVIFIGVVYTAFYGTLNINELVEGTIVLSIMDFFFVLCTVAVLESVFYWWIFSSLVKTIQQLTNRKQLIKLEMYKRFFGTLVVIGIISSILLAIQLYIGVMSDAMWRVWWVWDALWDLPYFAILVTIVMIWRPTQNKYQEVTDDVPDGEVVLQHVGMGETTQRIRGTSIDQVLM